MPRAYIHTILARAHALHAHTKHSPSCFFVCFVRLASRSTSQPSRNPRAPRTRVWYRPIYPCSPEASDGLTLPRGGGHSPLCASKPCTPPGLVLFLSGSRQDKSYNGEPLSCTRLRPGHATYCEYLAVPVMLYRRLPIILVPRAPGPGPGPGSRSLSTLGYDGYKAAMPRRS
ncbi:hypothetical protein CCMA1212_001012 [Trichoderma ghanense]|uniref:Uncharacterized protein n=1 Tax=Trichoderma ghanense TaxID=65468 RepID=A0ABY2HET1_9HYPO